MSPPIEAKRPSIEGEVFTYRGMHDCHHYSSSKQPSYNVSIQLWTPVTPPDKIVYQFPDCFFQFVQEKDFYAKFFGLDVLFWDKVGPDLVIGRYRTQTHISLRGDVLRYLRKTACDQTRAFVREYLVMRLGEEKASRIERSVQAAERII